ncbi:hypothetical protein IQ268_20805 [Oculatella sp. LEGE 06141]|uniref:hypothetical protein n=1 Tax=Oculatella sp. LEGE 06141 TaxID=1828648 RepID=UPI0018804E84|nr:hypothetical protein [Oculatella sp. LEGE 06141]MBE9181003.1 hypothetical protein [Oculatella sp. LEGE 06141]
MVKPTLLKVFAALALSCLLWVSSWAIAPTAHALTQIRLFDISYGSCPPDLAEGNVTTDGASMAANCYLVSGKAENATNKPVLNADIFGRIYDANGNSVMQNRTRLGSIDEVPPGISDFDLRITVPANQPTPLQLKQFKASGFSGRVRR